MEQEEVYGKRRGFVVMERTRRRRKRCGGGGGVTTGRRRGKSESGWPCIMLHLSIKFLVGRKKRGYMIRFIFQADLSGVTAAITCWGVTLIWSITSSQSCKQIDLLTLLYTHILVLRALSDRRRRETYRPRNERLTVQKKNAVCCRNERKVP